MAKLGVGVLGCSGHFARRVAEPIAASDRVEVRAIASRDAAKAAAAARGLGIPVAYGDYAAVLADPAVDFVYIPLPNHLHLEWIEKCADAGKPVLCEKPLGRNAAEARAAVEYCRARGVPLMEAFMYRFHGQWRLAAELLASGALGRVQAVRVVFAYDNRDPANIRNRPETGGGALLDIGCYAVSASRLAFGGEPVRAAALMEADPAFGTDRLSSALLDFGAGRHASFSVATQACPAQRVDIHGSAGWLSLEPPFNALPGPARLRLRDAVGAERWLEAPGDDQYRLMFEAFAASLAAGGAPPLAPEDAVANLAAMDAVSAAAASGAWAPVLAGA